ncbi:hypothetical protein, conserved [Leishmania lindenbergi]|uniref:Uncharacterized protein n=1 Tax=Leishmania lindenbergi TaxID=651832 RepID=A0AAW2ZZM4_9TRYP
MLFRDQHDSGNGAGAVGAGVVNQHNEEDETCSTGGRSYTSVESATAQHFEQRMAQLNDSMYTISDISSGAGGFCKAAFGIGGGAHAYLTPSYQLFPKVDGTYADIDSDDIDDMQRSLSLVAQTSNGEDSGLRRASHNKMSTELKLESFTDDKDEEDAGYLASLLKNIERHAERLDTKFYRYPPSEVIKQQIAMTAPPIEEREKVHTAATGSGAASAGTGGTPASVGDDSTAEDQSGSVSALSPWSPSQAPTEGPPAAPSPTVAAAPASSHSSGTKLFLGGLRYEVIQSGRHMVSWIFQVACGVRLSPSSILIHRKTKNGRSNVAPTGCASVFVAKDADVQALLRMNQRIYCAEEGIYVSPSPEVMKELIASKDIVDVTGGRVRGPTHPVVIERAYSLSHHHGQREDGGSGTLAHSSVGGGAAAGGSGGHRHARTSSASTESNLSNQHWGAMPPPYGSVPPPQYGTAHASPSGMPGSLQPPSYTTSSVSSSMGVDAVLVAGSLPTRASSTTLYPSSAVLSEQSSPSTQPMVGDARMPSPPSAAKALDLQRVTFHAYLHSDAMSHLRTTASSSSGMSSITGSSAAHHTVLFVAALPTETTPDYVSWLFSLMSITLPPSHIHIIGGGGCISTVSDPPGGASSSSAAKNMVDSCATVNLNESDILIALNYHHRVLCTSRGAWVGHSAQDIATLRASDNSLRDWPVLHVDRRMPAQAVTGVGSGSAAAPETPGYPHGGAGGEFARGSVAPYPPMLTQYPSPVFGGMPMMSAAVMGCVGNAMPYPMQWGFNMPSSSSNCMHAGVPPPSSQAGMVGGTMVPAMGAGAPPPPPLNLALPQQGIPVMPPPFPFPQTVTIGDRFYQLPPGSTLQFMPVITPAGGAGAGGEAEAGMGGASGGHWRSGPPGHGSASNAEASARPSTSSPHPDMPLPFSTRSLQKTP